MAYYLLEELFVILIATEWLKWLANGVCKHTKNGEVRCVYIWSQEANDMELKEQHQAQIWRRLAALIELDYSGASKVFAKGLVKI